VNGPSDSLTVRSSVIGLSLESSGLWLFSDFLLEVHASSAGDARRPVRTEPHPTALSVALCLEQSSSSFSFSIRSVGLTVAARVTRAAGFGRGCLPYKVIETSDPLRSV
jgi:hypothetical protein